MSKIHNLKSLEDAVYNDWAKFDAVGVEYLNEAGLAIREAYSVVIWHISFHDDLESLAADDNFQDLIDTPDKHPKYYTTLRKINRAIENAIKSK